MRHEDRDPSREPRRATMSGSEVRRSLDRLELLEGQDGRDGQDGRSREMARLAWRPAWSIRSRRGALGPFLDLFRGKG